MESGNHFKNEGNWRGVAEFRINFGFGSRINLSSISDPSAYAIEIIPGSNVDRDIVKPIFWQSFSAWVIPGIATQSARPA